MAFICVSCYPHLNNTLNNERVVELSKSDFSEPENNLLSTVQRDLKHWIGIFLFEKQILLLMRITMMLMMMI